VALTRSTGHALLALLALHGSAGAAPSFRLEETDGTVHYTNAPTSSRFSRMKGSGTDAGFLRFPGVQPARFAAEIDEASSRYGVPRRVVEAVIRAESAFNPSAVSPKGAQGLMQLMPQTASVLGVRDPFDARQNIMAGVRHLRGLMDRYGDDLSLSLAAYNAGERAVNAYRGVPPYPETQQYVRRILADLGGARGTSAPPPLMIYRVVLPDGSVTFTNISPQRASSVRSQHAP
jgi:hypothetical protein